MRKEMPEPEMRLWLELRASRFCGIKFRRQKVIGKYIADFAANEPKLVIEVDGDTHAGRERYDAIRTRYLEERGYKVTRFSNAEVMENLDGVLERLGQIIDEMTSPPPTPDPEGEGAKYSAPSLSPLQGRDTQPCEQSELGGVERGR